MGAPFCSNLIDSLLKGEPIEMPSVMVLEQPQPHGYRYRYECEGPSHGGLQGASSKKNSKTYPTISISNLVTPRAQVMVSLWTVDEPPRLHVHELIGKNCEYGKYTADVTSDTYHKIVFNNLSIKNTKKTDVVRILIDRKKKELGYPLSATSDAELVQAAEAEAKEVELNVVRLKFEVIVCDDIVPRVVASAMSQPVYDSKSPAASLLKICRISCSSGSCRGGTEVFLLCEKVQKDIMVRFREKEGDVVKWEDFGRFNATDVHRQYAIVFKTPAYRDQQLAEDVEVDVQLYRASDGQESPAVPFKYCADKSEYEQILRKRRKLTFSPVTAAAVDSVTPGTEPAASSSIFSSSVFPLENIGFNVLPLPDFSTLSGSTDLLPEFNIFPTAVHPMASNYVFNADLTEEFAAHNVDLLTPTLNVSAVPNFGSISSGAQSSRVSQAMRADLSEDVVEMDFADPTWECTEVVSTSARVPQCDIKQLLPGADYSKQSYQAVADRNAWYSPLDGKTRSTVPRLTSEQGKGSETSPATVAGGKPHQVPPCRLALQTACETTSAGPASTASAPTGSVATPLASGCSTAPEKLVDRVVCALHDYVRSGDPRFVLAAFRELFDEPDENGDNALHVAVIHERHDILRYLLSAAGSSATAGLHAHNLDGQTPLHIAVVLRLARTVELLLQHGADPRRPDAHGNTAWHLAANGNDIATLRILRSTAVPSTTKLAVNALNYNGLSPLHVAVQGGHTDCVKELVASGADANIGDGKSGRTPLHYAIERGSFELTSYFILNAGANVDQASYDGNTPLHLACAVGNLGIVATLMACGADPWLENCDPKECERDMDEAECVHGHTPRDLAINDQIVDLLDGKPCRQSATGSDWRWHQSAVSNPARLSGDMDRLDEASRHALASMLDRAPQLWARLAELVGLKDHVPTLRTESSPTRALLADFEAIDGSTADLCRYLAQMNLHEAAQLVRKQCPAHASVRKIETLSGSHCDSGVGASFTADSADYSG